MKEKNQLSRLKVKSLQLKKGGQIPPFLYFKIVSLSVDDDVRYVSCLRELTEHYLRIKNYYFKYRNISDKCDTEIKNYLKERGYI